MQTLRVSFRPAAVSDLRSIFDYVLEISQNLQIAEGFARRIKARCDRIGYAPLGGRPRDDLAQGLRTVPFEKSVVITYVIVSDYVEITNIFYGGRDYQMFYRGHQSTDPDA
jgi:toxin ParE1/3/4